MMPSRGMGAISPSKMPKGARKARRDDTNFTQYAEGGSVGCQCHKMAQGGKAGLQAILNSAKTAKK